MTDILTVYNSNLFGKIYSLVFYSFEEILNGIVS